MNRFPLCEVNLRESQFLSDVDVTLRMSEITRRNLSDTRNSNLRKFVLISVRKGRKNYEAKSNDAEFVSTQSQLCATIERSQRTNERNIFPQTMDDAFCFLKFSRVATFVINKLISWLTRMRRNQISSCVAERYYCDCNLIYFPSFTSSMHAIENADYFSSE